MNSKDFGKLIALFVAGYGVYTAYQSWQRNENVGNGVGLIVAGVTAFTTLRNL